MKIAFTTTLDDTYFDGFIYTFASILKSSNNFNYDLIIFEWNNLSEKNKEKIKSFYPNVIFKKVEEHHYVNHNFDTQYRVWNYNCNYRFDIFTLEYDKVVYFDCDMLFEIPVSELLAYDVDFGACQMPNKKSDNQVIGLKIFNAGLMVIGKKYLNIETRNELIRIANIKPSRHRNWTGNQPILNRFFLEKITWLPNKFNIISEDFCIDMFLEKNNYHFVGKLKPWNLDPNQRYEKHILNCISTNHSYNLLSNRMVIKNIENRYKELNDFIFKNFSKSPFD
jgi:lipopolysaccharide biosynthesis glycosyltransferase